MKRVCIKFLIVLITLFAIFTNDIQVKISEILIFSVVFIFVYNLFRYVNNYLKERRERQKFDLIIKTLQKYIDGKVPSKQLRTDKSDKNTRLTFKTTENDI